MPDFARSAHPQVQAQLDRLSKLSPGGDQLGLERISALLERLGRPQDRLPPVFHVAGTNGKGSTCAFLRAVLEAAGFAVHAFTSPHLVRFNERIRLAGKLIADDRLASLLTEVLDASDGIEPSFFEVTTAVAFLAFVRTPADACVVEVGLGGRLDATNLIEHPLVTGIANLGIDHTQFLGSTLAEIAAEKAGIAKPGVPLITMAYPEEAYLAIANAVGPVGRVWAPMGLAWDAWVDGSEMVVSDDRGEARLPLPAMPGAHQWQNAALAVEMIRSQDRLAVPDAAFAMAMRNAHWPARFQRLADGPLGSVETWIDGAHNCEAARALASHLAIVGPMHIVLGILANKDADAIVGALAPHALSLTFVPVADHAHHDPQGLAERFRGRAAASIEAALIGLPAPRLIAGSLYLAGAALAANDETPD
jgi:dihydrofolate synthase/folylpolyglutamate synthase